MNQKKLFISLSTLIISMLSIQGGASLAKGLFVSYGAIGTSALRVSFAAIILFLFWRPYMGRGQSLTYKNWSLVVAYGMSLGLMNMFFYQSLEYIPLGIAVGLEFLGPLTVALINSRKRTDFLWIIFALVGILLILPLHAESELPLIGIVYALLAAFCWAMYIIFGQKAGSFIKGSVITTYGMMVAALVVIIIFFLTNSETELYSFSLFQKMLPMILFVAILSSALPYSLEMISLKHLSSKTFGILMSLEPAIATLMGFILLSEKLGFRESVAIGLIIIASFGSALSSAPSAHATVEQTQN